MVADTYKVISQVPTTAAMPGGTFVPSMEITFETLPSHVAGKVTVPQSQYSPDEVDRVLRQSAATIEAVQAL